MFHSDKVDFSKHTEPIYYQSALCEFIISPDNYERMEQLKRSIRSQIQAATANLHRQLPYIQEQLTRIGTLIDRGSASAVQNMRNELRYESLESQGQAINSQIDAIIEGYSTPEYLSQHYGSLIGVSGTVFDLETNRYGPGRVISLGLGTGFSYYPTLHVELSDGRVVNISNAYVCPNSKRILGLK